VNPFKKYNGLRLNGQHYEVKSLRAASMDDKHPAHLREIFAFSAKLFDRTYKVGVTTSGSTGKPKQMTFPKKAFEASAAATNKYFSLDAECRALLALPMRYIAGKMMVVRAVVGGYELTAVPPASQPFIKAIAEAARSGDFDFVPLTPHQAASVLESDPQSLAAVKAVLIGGGQVSDELRGKLIQAGVKAYASFGMTETLSHFALARLSAGSDPVYFPVEGVEIKIRKNGNLSVRWKEVTQHRIETNDLVEAREKGFVWKGRTDNLINSGGIKVIPEQVEKRLAHLIRAPFFVSGIPHDKLGEEVALFLEAEGLPTSDLLAEVQHALSDTPFWQPRRLIALSEFEYTPTGKIMRSETVRKSVPSK